MFLNRHPRAWVPNDLVIGSVLTLGGSAGAGAFDANDQGDLALGTWTSRTALPPGGLLSPTAFHLSGKVHLACGYSTSVPGALDDADTFDPATNAWAAMTDFPGIGRSQAGAFAISSVGHVFGGISGTTPRSDNYGYTQDTDAWAAKTDLPDFARRLMTAFCGTDGNGYSVGGYADDEDTKRRADVDQYDGTGDSWSAMTDLSASHYAGGGWGGGVGGYAVNGINDGGYTPAFADKYNAATDSWASVTAHSARRDASASASGYGVIAGGTAAARLATAAAYDMDADSWTNLDSLTSARDSNYLVKAA